MLVMKSLLIILTKAVKMTRDISG